MNNPMFREKGIITKLDVFIAVMVGYLFGVLFLLATMASKGVFP